MNVQYHLEVSIPRRKDGINGQNVTLIGDIPFVPQIGMFIIAAKGDDCRKVESVYWGDEGTGKPLLQVFFEFCELTKLKDVLRAGWLVNEL